MEHTESGAPLPKPDAQKSPRRATPSPVDPNEIEDWDYCITRPPRRNVEIIEVEVIDVGRARPLPYPDPAADDEH